MAPPSNHPEPSSLSRRNFLKGTALGAGLLPGCAGLLPARKKHIRAGQMRHACIGVGGQGKTDSSQIGSHQDVTIVALCDVDRNLLEEAGKHFPEARLYQDWRRMLRMEAGNIDSVSVSTPDHMHAPITVAALRKNLHVYCQKPLTHTVKEARIVAEEAAISRGVGQMGIQNHSNLPLRQALEVFRAGVIGPVREAHVWTDRPAGWWPQNVDRPEGEDPIPTSLDWDGWLGVAPKRPYKKGAYHRFVWRGRKDFGTGAQGDMACHLMDPVPWYMELGDPISVRSDGPMPTADAYPAWSQITYRFAATPWTASSGTSVTWHDGKRKPDALLKSLGVAEDSFANAALFVGSEGALMVSPYEPCRLLPEQEFGETQLPKLKPRNHWHQWVDSCFGREKPVAGFTYAGALTEIALLGNIALHFPGENLLWDGGRFRFTGRDDATAMLDKPYRKGWKIKGLS